MWRGATNEPHNPHLHLRSCWAFFCLLVPGPDYLLRWLLSGWSPLSPEVMLQRALVISAISNTDWPFQSCSTFSGLTNGHPSFWTLNARSQRSFILWASFLPHSLGWLRCREKVGSLRGNNGVPDRNLNVALPLFPDLLSPSTFFFNLEETRTTPSGFKCHF